MSTRQTINLYSQIPMDIASKSYENIELIAEMSEKYKFKGALIFYTHFSLDPWVVTSKILQSTVNLIPLVAVQPYSIPPFTLAKTVSAIAALYGRKVSLNMVTGGRDNELLSVGEQTNPDQKNSRLQEYIEVLKSLLRSDEPFSYRGQYYYYKNLINHSAIEADLMPDFFIPGSSDSSIELAHSQADYTVLRPQPVKDFEKNYMTKIDRGTLGVAIRFSIIARPESEEAWEIARAAYPTTKIGKMITRMRKNHQSHNQRLMASLADNEVYDNVFWMGAFQTGNRRDPFLVGSYKEVADYLISYINAGATGILLGHLETEEDFIHINEVIKLLEMRL